MADYGIQLGKVFFVGLLSVILTMDVVVGASGPVLLATKKAETAENFSSRRPSSRPC